MQRFSALPREVRLEYMRPAQIDAARAERSAVYLSFGSIEWHGRQNPLGVDGLWGHALLVDLALREGGVVYPPVFLGAGGEHANFPYTNMVESAAMTTIVVNLLHGFERSGFTTAILLAGHAPNIIPPTNFISQAVEAYRTAGGRLRVLPLIVWMAGVPIDHAGTMETSAMLHYYPQTVEMAAITGPEPAGLPKPGDNWMAEIYRDHPCYGICRPDPRNTASAAYGEEQSAAAVNFLADWLHEKPAAIEHLRQFRHFAPISG